MGQALSDEELAGIARASSTGAGARRSPRSCSYGQAAGEFGPTDPDELALLLASLLDGLSVQIALNDIRRHAGAGAGAVPAPGRTASSTAT